MKDKNCEKLSLDKKFRILKINQQRLFYTPCMTKIQDHFGRKENKKELFLFNLKNRELLVKTFLLIFLTYKLKNGPIFKKCW